MSESEESRTLLVIWWEKNKQIGIWKRRWKRAYWTWRDLRLTWVLGTLLLASFLSYGYYKTVPTAMDATTFEGAAFASWLAGLALAVVVTLSITLATIARPHAEVFEARARNLLRRQAGPHIDHIIPQIQKLLQPYCEEAVREMFVTDYNNETQIFRVNQYTNNYLKSYLNDMPVKFESKLAYLNGTAAPNGHETCSLTYLRVGGDTIAENERFNDKLTITFSMLVHPHETCQIEHRMAYWVKAKTERNRHVPVRFTNHLTVLVHNQLPSQPIKASVFAVSSELNEEGVEVGPDGKPIDSTVVPTLVKEIRIPAGSVETVIKLDDLPPRRYAYDFRLELA